MDTVVPGSNFPDMDSLFLERPARSVEVANGVARLTRQLGSLTKDVAREYVTTHYLLLYARTQGTVPTCFRSATTGSSPLIFERWPTGELIS